MPSALREVLLPLVCFRTNVRNMSVVLTIGHSTRPIEEFVALLKAHEVTCVADVRTIPRSRRHPQFEQKALEKSLKTAGINYCHFPALGGLRRPSPDSVNMGWRNSSFRGYADHMQSKEFERSLHDLVDLAKRERVAVMCAEAVPWRCHRSLIADALLAREVEVQHIMSATQRNPHKLTPFAQVRGTTIVYPSADVRQPVLPTV